MNRSSFIHWNSLPNEIKVIIAKQLDKESRLNLRACSKNDKELVDSVKIREMHKIDISCRPSQSFMISLTQTKYGDEVSFKSNSPDFFQRNVVDRIDEYDFIDVLEIYLIHKIFTVHKDPSLRVNFTSSHGKLVKVKVLDVRNINVESCLDQVDPDHLKCLSLSHLDAEFYDIPLVINVNELYVEESSIRNDQLLKLENQTLILSNCENLTLKGINKYIQKCVQNLDNKQVAFKFDLSIPTGNHKTLFDGLDVLSFWEKNSFTGMAVVKSKYGNFRLNIDYSNNIIEGKTSIRYPLEKRIDMTKNFKFTIVDTVKLELKGEYILTISRNNCENKYYFNYPEEEEKLQQKLIKEIEGIDYIKYLIICVDKKRSGWILCPKNQQITVRGLIVRNGDYTFEYLQQLKRGHLKGICIRGTSRNKKIYSLPQIREAVKLEIDDCEMNDYQLLQLNAVSLQLSADPEIYTTNSGVNAFLKKCIRNLNNNDYDISFLNINDEDDPFDIFEGLEIFEPETRSGRRGVLLVSPFSEYLLQVYADFCEIKARRVHKSLLTIMWG